MGFVSPHMEFAYNRSSSKATGMSFFKVICGVDPLSPFDLTPKAMDEKSSVEASKRVEEIQRLHALVKSKIEQSNASY